MGKDEAQARAFLLAMQGRLHDPHAALGIAGNATTAEIRSAFLELTKQYHPARFGRMTPELQRLANEVFLGLRAAHDALARPGGKSGRQPPPASTASNLPKRPSTPPMGTPAVATSPRITPARGTPILPSRSTPPPNAPARSAPPGAAATVPSAPIVPAGAQGSGATRTPHPSPNRWPQVGTTPGSLPTRAPASPSPAPTTSSQPRPAAGTDAELAAATELLGKSQWQAARTLITALSTRSPENPRYRAMLAYARGREAQLLGRIDEARVELEQALQIDPGLQLAKTALGELFTRRK